MVLSINELSARVGDLRVEAGNLEDEVVSMESRIAESPNPETTKILQEARLERRGQVKLLRQQIATLEEQAERQGGMIGSIDSPMRTSNLGPIGGRRASRLPSLYSDGFDQHHHQPDPAGPRLTICDQKTGKAYRAYRQGEPVCTDPPEVGLGDLIVAQLTNSFDHIGDLEARQSAIEISQSATSYASGELFVDSRIWSQHLDLLRAKSRVTAAGSQVVPVDTEPAGAIVVTETTQDATFQWLPELGAATSSSMQFKSTQLVFRKLIGYAVCSREVLTDSVNAASIFETTLLSGMAGELDRACLVGSGQGSEIRGIVNHASVNTVSSVGVPTNFSEIVDAIQEIYADNFDGDPSELAWLYAPRELGQYAKLQDSQLQPMAEPKIVSDLQHFCASTLPTTGGDGGDESQMVVGHFPSVLIFMRQLPRIEVLREGSIVDENGTTLNATSQDAIILKASLRVALCVLRPSLFAVLSGVTAS